MRMKTFPVTTSGSRHRRIKRIVNTLGSPQTMRIHADVSSAVSPSSDAASKGILTTAVKIAARDKPAAIGRNILRRRVAPSRSRLTFTLAPLVKSRPWPT
jgi:hypothetical protein